MVPSPGVRPASRQLRHPLLEVDEDLVARGLTVQNCCTHARHCAIDVAARALTPPRCVSVHVNTSPDVFSPAKLGPLTLRNRIIKAATFEAATPNALVTDDLINYHRRPAAGGVGMTTVAYCAVSPGGRTDGRQIWMRPEAVPGPAQAHRRHPRRGRGHQRADRPCRPGRRRPVQQGHGAGAGAVLQPAAMRFAKKATVDDIDDVIAAHANAARLAIDAGFDAVEIHLGHNYFCQLVPQPADQPARRRVRRLAGEPGQGGARRRAGGAARGREDGDADRRDRQAQHGRRRARRHPDRGVAADRQVAARTTAAWTPSS